MTRFEKAAFREAMQKVRDATSSVPMYHIDEQIVLGCGLAFEGVRLADVVNLYVFASKFKEFLND